MRVGLRVLLGYFVILALAAVLIAQVFVQQVKPGVRQAMEDTLIDTANLLAELAAEDFRKGQMASGQFARAVEASHRRDVGADVYGFSKLRTAYRIRITDIHGVVIFDSEGKDVGQDHSRWRDVYLTLRGQYGARSSPESADDPENTVMHVSAPIRVDGQLVGVLTVAKPNRTVAPFIERSQKKVMNAGAALLIGALLVGIVVAWWISSQLSRLRRYADAVTRGERAATPVAHGEFGVLGQALATMREKLEGKQYVEEYVHALTHELKSPLAAIRGSAELLQEQGDRMSKAEREAFIGSIHEQSGRLAQMVDKLLALAAVEHRQALQAPQRIDLDEIFASLEQDVAATAQARQVRLEITPPAAMSEIRGDAFLLRQALGNLLANAVDFSPPGATVQLWAEDVDGGLCLNVRDHGSGIPEYAKNRVFERFYSLARPDGSSRSSGLGLPFVAEVAALHHGHARLVNHPDGGALATLWLPGARMRAAAASVTSQ